MVFEYRTSKGRAKEVDWREIFLTISDTNEAKWRLSVSYAGVSKMGRMREGGDGVTRGGEGNEGGMGVGRY